METATPAFSCTRCGREIGLESHAVVDGGKVVCVNCQPWCSEEYSKQQKLIAMDADQLRSARWLRDNLTQVFGGTSMADIEIHGKVRELYLERNALRVNNGLSRAATRQAMACAVLRDAITHPDFNLEVLNSETHRERIAMNSVALVDELFAALDRATEKPAQMDTPLHPVTAP